MPLSRNEEARQRSLANLRRGVTRPAPGNQRARRHGGFALAATGAISELLSTKFYEGLSEASPLRTDATFAFLVAIVSNAFQRLEDLTRQINLHRDDLGSARVQRMLDAESRVRGECLTGLQKLQMAPEELDLRAFVEELRASVDAARRAASGASAQVEIVHVIDATPREATDAAT